jgi:hypothetical protein
VLLAPLARGRLVPAERVQLFASTVLVASARLLRLSLGGAPVDEALSR